MVAGAVLLTLAAVASSYFLWSRRKFYMCALKLRGPIGLPLIGIAHKIYKLEEILYVLPKFAKEYKAKSYFSWLGPFPVVYTIDPKVAEIVLQSPDCLNKAMAYDAINDAVGNGLLTSKTPKWTKHRKLLNPCFGYKVLLDMFPTFNNFARELCGKIDNCVGHGEVNIRELTLSMGLKASIAITMGTDVKDESGSKVLESFEGILGFIINRILRPWFKTMAMYTWSSEYKLFIEARSCIRNFVKELIRTKLKVLEETKNNNNSDQDSEEKAKVSQVFIDQAIRIHQQKEFTVDEVVDEATIMVIAAYETTANTLYSTLMFLAMNPHYQERVFDEISTIYSSKEFDVTYEDFKSLVYLEMCINETLRLTPSIPLIARKIGSDLRISEDVTIPAGGEIYIDIFNIHRDEDIWGPTALTYDPDHFLPSNLENKHKCAFMPFSKGKRNCLGWQYAGMFLRVMLAQILRKYRFSTTFRFEDLKCVEYISLKYVTTPRLEVHRR